MSQTCSGPISIERPFWKPCWITRDEAAGGGLDDLRAGALGSEQQRYGLDDGLGCLAPRLERGGDRSHDTPLMELLWRAQAVHRAANPGYRVQLASLLSVKTEL